MHHSENLHNVKGIHFWSFSGPHFPAFRLNMETNSGNIRIHSDNGKRRKNPRIRSLFTQYFPYLVFLHEVPIWKEYYTHTNQLFLNTVCRTFFWKRYASWYIKGYYKGESSKSFSWMQARWNMSRDSTNCIWYNT